MYMFAYLGFLNRKMDDYTLYMYMYRALHQLPIYPVFLEKKWGEVVL